MYLQSRKRRRFWVSRSRPRVGLGSDLSYYSGSTNGWPDWLLSPLCGDFAASTLSDNLTPVCRMFHAKNSAELGASMPSPVVSTIPVPQLNPDGSAANSGTAVDDLIRANKARQDVLNQQFFEGLPDAYAGDDAKEKNGWSPFWLVPLGLVAGFAVWGAVARR